MSKTENMINEFDTYVMKTYTRYPVVIVKGAGSKVWDSDGKEYLDFFPGYAVSGLGHCHPAIVAAMKEQLDKVIHVPNTFYNELQGKLAETISRHSFPGKCFFSNSGAEANEGALKLARKYGADKGKYKVVSLKQSFHGRTMATVAATGQEKYQKGFDPLVPGFSYAQINDFDSVKELVDDETCAVMIELIQGEGGINVANESFVKNIRDLCSEQDMVMIVDEVQTGMGRTGTYFGFQQYGIVPDVITLAKTLGGGMVIGAMIARGPFGDVLVPGTHASTFGGSPLACSAALAVFDVFEKEDILGNVIEKGAYLREKMTELQEKYSVIKEIRGLGLMLGMELSVPCSDVVKAMLDEGVIMNCTAGNVLRFMPAMTVTTEEIDQTIATVEKVLTEWGK